MSKGKSKWVIIFELFIIVLGLTSVTLAVKYIMDSYNLSVSTSSLAVADLNENVTSGELIPLEDSSITKDTTDNVLRMTFNVKGAVTNTNSNIIYDIVLKDILADCTLMNENIKWNLYKNNELLSTGSFAPSFDTSILDNTLTLTSTQENLKSYISSGDEYIFILWMSEPCTSSDITTCIGVLDNSDMLGETVSASIDVRLYTGKKKAINRSTFNTKACNIIRGNINDGIYNLNDSTGTNNVTTTGGVYAVSHDAIDASKSATGETIAATTDYRYYGKNPNNYVWFNCSTLDTNGHSYGDDDYEYNTTNCEKWLMIGSFETDVPIYDANGNITGYDTKYLTKIKRLDSIGSYVFDYNNKADWSNSSLMKLLNFGYETNDDDGDGNYESNSLYYNRTTGKCYYNVSDKVMLVDCDFSNSGIKNETKDYIETVRWFLGGSDGHDGYIEHYYEVEHGNYVLWNDVDKTWIGKIGLIYPSDYGYAAGYDFAINSSTRRRGYNGYSATDLNDYRQSDSVNYLYTANMWLMGQSGWFSSYVSIVGHRGGALTIAIGSGAFFASGRNPIYPTLHLKSNTTIVGGDGTSESPYVIELE